MAIDDARLQAFMGHCVRAGFECGGFRQFRRANETPFNLVCEAGPQEIALAAALCCDHAR